MTGEEYRVIREALGLSRPALAALIRCSSDGSTIKKRETGEVAITAAAEAEIIALNAAYDAGRSLRGAAAEAARAKRGVAASQPTATPLHAARLRLQISQDEVVYQLGEAGECEPPARSSYQAWENGKRSTPPWVSDAAARLEKDGLFKAPQEPPTASEWIALAAVGAVIIGATWLATRAAKAA
jgi:transcriptional regulator with XRE-family HTH domain